MSFAASEAATAAAIEVHDLVKSFGAFYALRGVSLRVLAGECVTIFGPNGAGKTTFLRILSALTRPTSGEVLILGNSLKEKPFAIKQQLGVIGHQTFLYDDLTAAENLLFYARLYDVPSPHARLEHLLAEVGLERRANDRVRSFSRGMQQRLALARAMLHDPGILFLDEPYTGLDQHAAMMLTNWLQKLRNERRTILLVTHDLAQGLAMADRVAVFLQGRLIWEERAAQIATENFQQTYFDLIARGGK
jgi:heme exporter protein A